MTKSGALDHVGISVAHLDSMLQWYADTFDMRILNHFEVAELQLRGAFLLSSAGLVLELLEREGSVAQPLTTNQPERLLHQGLAHVCLRVDDVDSTHARVIAAGGQERMAPCASPEPNVRMSFVADPEGNFIELIDRKEPIQ